MRTSQASQASSSRRAVQRRLSPPPTAWPPAWPAGWLAAWPQGAGYAPQQGCAALAVAEASCTAREQGQTQQVQAQQAAARRPHDTWHCPFR